MLICRMCGKEAFDSRREWGNERVAFIYSHNGQGEHRKLVDISQAQEILEEDYRRARGVT